jgi:hypothetical protein
MCFFGRSSTPQPPKPEFDDAPPVVTGKQTGVDNPIDTKKVTEQLRQDRMKQEGFSNPAESLKIAGITGGGGGLGAKEKSERSARLRSGVSRGPRKPSKAQKAAAARKAMKSKR